MASSEMQAFNAHARTALKAAMNANYDPVEFRRGRPPVVMEANSEFTPLSFGRLEFRRPRRDGRLVVYVAGGGFCFDAGDGHRQFVDEIAHGLGAGACLIRYRLAPEHAFPSAFDDVAEGLEVLLSGRRAEDVVVIADSAGGALVLSAVMARLAAGKSAPARLVLLSALTDMAMTGLSHVANAEADPLFGPQALIHKIHHYLQGANPTDPRASPFWGDPTGLPPSLFLVGSTEVMRDDSTRFVERAVAAGVDARASICEDAPHTFPLFAQFPESAVARAEIVGFLGEAWT